MKLHTRLFIAGALLALFGGRATATTLPRPCYIDPAGSDTEGNGTTTRPFLNVDRCRKLITAEGWNVAQTADQYIYANTGTYPAQSVVFGNADSGSGGHDIVVTPTSGTPGDAVLTGGVKLSDAGWTLFAAGPPAVYKHLLPAIPGTYSPVRPHELSENEVRGIYARSPNLSVDARWPLAFTPYFTSLCDGTVTDSTTLLRYNPVDITPAGLTLGNYGLKVWSTLAGGRIQWFTDGAPVSALDSVNHRFTVNLWDSGGFKFGGCSGGSGAGPNGVGAYYVVEGDESLIDQAGEWALCDATGATVCYASRGGGAPTNVWVGSGQRVISVVGSDSSHLASHITLKNLEIEYSDFGIATPGSNVPSYRFSAAGGQSTQDYGPYQQQNASAKGGLVYAENAANVTLDGLHLKLAGLSAVFFEGYVQNSTLKNSLIEHCGTDCVMGDGPAPATADTQTHNTITNVYGTDGGERHSGSVLRLDQGSFWTVSQSEFLRSTRDPIVTSGWSTSPYTGPCTPNFNYAHDNTFTGLILSDGLQDSGDNGCFTFEFADRCGASNVLINSLVRGCYSNPAVTDFPPNSVFTDNKTDGMPHTNVGASNASTNRYRHNDNTPGTLTNTSYNADGSVNSSFDPTLLTYSAIGILSSHPYYSLARLAYHQVFSGNSAPGYGVNTGSLAFSNAQVDSGTTASIVLGQTTGQVVTYWFGRHLHQKVVVRFYDTATDHVDAMVRCDDADPSQADTINTGNGWLNIGVDAGDGRNTNYTYWFGPAPPFAAHDTGKARSTGWHSFVFDFSDGEHAKLSIDSDPPFFTGEQVGFQSFSRCSAGDFQGAGNHGAVFLGGVQVL